MALLTSTEVRTHVETGLVDAALQRIMDAAEEDRNTPTRAGKTPKYCTIVFKINDM